MEARVPEVEGVGEARGFIVIQQRFQGLHVRRKVWHRDLCFLFKMKGLSLTSSASREEQI